MWLVCGAAVDSAQPWCRRGAAAADGARAPVGREADAGREVSVAVSRP